MPSLFKISNKLGRRIIILPMLYMLLIFIFSSIPGDDSTRFSSFFDQINPGVQNLMHIPLFAGLTILWVLTLLNYKMILRKILFYSFFISWSYGLFDEFHQFYVPGRYPGLIDVILNTLGIVLVLTIFIKFANLRIA